MPKGELLAQFKFLSQILKQPGSTEIDERLAHLAKLIDENIPKLLKKNAPPDSYELYADFKAYYEQFYNFVLYDRLIGKSVVALGGGFSSGKSSFLNALDGERALPTDISPSTAVPTFIVNGAKHEVFSVNIFNAVIPIEELKIIRSISHGFGEIKDENGKVLTQSITLGHILKSVFLASPKQRYLNLAFVDTPGFSKPDSDTYSAKTDEYISRGQLNSSSYIILFVQADAGTLKDEDLRFIKSLRTDIPKLFVISKADLKTEKDLQDIKTHIKSQLITNAIPLVDVLAFSANQAEGYDANAIRSILSQWNQTQEVPQFSRNFKRLFIRCRTYYEKTIEYQRQRLERLNTSLTKFGDSSLSTLVKDAKEQVDKLKESNQELAELSKEFFTELKKVCDKIGVSMPEPSERDMYEDIPDALELMQAYKKQHGVKTNRSTLDMIKSTFKGVSPALDSAAGGSAHQEAMLKLIRDNCRVDAAHIRINEAVNGVNLYQENIQKLMATIKLKAGENK